MRKARALSQRRTRRSGSISAHVLHRRSRISLASALAIGLLIGAERERRKGEGPLRSAAGIRTFALVSLLGGVSVVLGGNLLLAVTTGVIAAFCVAAYLRMHEQDPGLTSEAALGADRFAGRTSTEADGYRLGPRGRRDRAVGGPQSPSPLCEEGDERRGVDRCSDLRGCNLGGPATDARPLPRAVRRDQSSHYLENCGLNDLDQRSRVHRSTADGRSFRTAGGWICVGLRFQHGDHRCNGRTRCP